MQLAHSDEARSALSWAVLVPWTLLGAAALAYALAAATQAHRRRPSWGRWRTASFLAGLALLAYTVSPQMDGYADDDFAGHMAQHLLLGMVAPLALVLGAPVTLALRSLPPAGARLVAHAVRSRYARLVSRPEVALLLNVGGLLVLYFTPLYGISTRHEGVHQLVHLHVFATGYLFAWVIAGPDAAPHRASVRARLVTLGAAIAAHASAAQLMYAGLLVQVHEPAAQLRSAGDLMYFGGDIAELALALALLLTWRPSQARRSGAAGANRETANKPAGDLSPTF